MKWPDRFPREMECWVGTRGKRRGRGPGVRLERCEGLKMIFLKKGQNYSLIYIFGIMTLLNVQPCVGLGTNYDI